MKLTKLLPVSPVNMLDGPVFSSIFRFSIPLLISSLFQALYSAVDVMLVGNMLGSDKLAAIGAGMPVYDLLIGFAFGMGTGLTVVTARSFGSRDRDLMRRSVAAALIIAACVAAVMTAAALCFEVPILKLLHTPESVIGPAGEYITIISAFAFVTVFFNLASGLLHSIGNSMMPMLFLLISNVLNIILDYVFMGPLKMGLKGAASATVLAQAFALFLSSLYLVFRCSYILPGKSDWKFDRDLYTEMTGQGLASALLHSVVCLGTAALQAGINSLGPGIIAAHTTARRIYSFLYQPGGAMTQAAITFASQNRGAGRWDRIFKGIRTVSLYNLALVVVESAFIFLTAETLMKLVSGSDDPSLIQAGVRYLRFVTPCIAVLHPLMLYRGILQSIGRKLLPALSSFIELAGKVLFMKALVPMYGYDAVIVSEPAIWCVMTAYLVAAFYLLPEVREQRKQTI